MKCINCGKRLSGRQRKFCGRQCKNTYNNYYFQSYQAQQIRGRERKLELIQLKGMKCSRCGYHKNYAALELHHIDPTQKKFQLDLRSLSNRKWEVIIEEVEKCILVCSNCHSELHNPDCAID